MSAEPNDISFHRLVITASPADQHVAQIEEQPVTTPPAAVAEEEQKAPQPEEPEEPDSESEVNQSLESISSREPYYVHIDLRDVKATDAKERSAKNGAIARHINKYMLTRYHYDPRRYHNFFDAVWAGEGNRRPTRAEMIQAADMNYDYYELWRVKGDFDEQEFYDSFTHSRDVRTGVRLRGELVTGFTVKMCSMHGADGHTNTGRSY